MDRRHGGRGVSFLNQSRFPTLWQWFQYLIGGSCHKRRMARLRYSGAVNVLEVGCSVGNLATAFKSEPSIRYVGVDIDQAAIRRAQRVFRRRPNFTFVCGDLCALDLEPFDYIILSAMLHHVNDADCQALLAACARLLNPAGHIVITDPVVPHAHDPWLVHLIDRVEQGQFVRSYERLLQLVQAAPGVSLQEQRQFFLGGSPLGWPRIARCAYFHLRREAASAAAAA
jgi:SAM-dependent methyltransferase